LFNCQFVVCSFVLPLKKSNKKPRSPFGERGWKLS
jgi:hypothetical protein